MHSPGKGRQATQKVTRTALCLALGGVSLLASAPLTVASAEPVRVAELPVPAGTATLRVAPGARVVIPLPDVTRILPDDHDIVRAHYQNGKGVLEGVTRGK